MRQNGRFKKKDALILLMIECSCHIDFCCAHRILGHDGKCANLHGHNYDLLLYAKGERLDELGRVIDFSALKKEIKDWIDNNWDHNLLVFEKDEGLMAIKDNLLQEKSPFVCCFNTTAENMALYLINKVCPDLFDKLNIVISKIELSETNKNKVIMMRERD
ncbi:MAG: 6-carboxytetrahydropterin synthase [Bacteriovoracaceae bacterium]